MEEIIFATNNGHKLEEVQAILSDRFRLLTLRECGITEDVPETQPTIEGNALQKARYVNGKTGRDCFADDTGLEVYALGGALGVHSARYATDWHDFAANVTLLLKNLEGAEDRRARFRTVIALIIGGREYTFEGIIEGVITPTAAGCGGFGYDPVFVPAGFGETFAPMSPPPTHSTRHPALSVRWLAAFPINTR